MDAWHHVISMRRRKRRVYWGTAKSKSCAKPRAVGWACFLGIVLTSIWSMAYELRAQSAPFEKRPINGSDIEVRRLPVVGEDGTAEPVEPPVPEPSKSNSDSAFEQAPEQALIDTPSPEEGPDLPPDLSLSDVIASTYRCYPEIQRAREEFRRTDGELLTSWGAYDLKLKGYSLNEPTGFYENHRHHIGLARQTWWGGYLSAGYRIGRGDFQPWYKERETDKGGEFKLGWVQPLLRGRAIDPQRVAVFQASLARQASQPTIQQAILDNAAAATEAYWKWVEAGNVQMGQQELLDLAVDRGKKFEALFAAGKFAEIDVILNRQLIAERQVKVLESQRKFQAAAFKLSLYLRNETCEPMIAATSWLPERFPVTERPQGNLQQDLLAALGQRPEPRLLQFEIRQVQLDRQLASNDLLPNVDFVAEASQDVGIPASSSDDKGEFLLVVGLQGEVPIQRRKARGKIQSTSAKIAQLQQKLILQRNRIEVELRTAYNALQLSSDVVVQAEIALRAATETLSRYQFAFDSGKIDLIYLNLLETKANETEIKLIQAQANWFVALGQMQAALGLDPLEQSMLLGDLPRSDRPGPGRLPKPREIDAEALQQDWERRNIAE